MCGALSPLKGAVFGNLATCNFKNILYSRLLGNKGVYNFPKSTFNLFVPQDSSFIDSKLIFYMS